MAPVTDVKPEAVLSNDEILRYSRHLIMPEVGMDGQQKLKAAKVLCIGAGGLGRVRLQPWHSKPIMTRALTPEESVTPGLQPPAMDGTIEIVSPSFNAVASFCR